MNSDRPQTNQIILDSVRHNNWATGRLLEFCRPLTEEQLATPGIGTYGGILATLDHIIRCDGSYVGRLAGEKPGWTSEPAAGIDELRGWNNHAGQLWERLVAEPFDTERVIIIYDGASAVRAGIFIAQAINHANHHREQVCSILTGFGIQPPDIQAWSYGWVTGRMWANG